MEIARSGVAYLVCDGDGCEATCCLDSNPGRVESERSGWYYFIGSDFTHHYCPQCGSRHVQALLAGRTAPEAAVVGATVPVDG